MPICQNCTHQWSWPDTVIIGFKNNKNCPHCGERQYVTPNSQKVISLFTYIPLIIFIFLNSIYDLANIVFLSFITLFVLGMFIYIPYTIKLSNEQKPLW